jgi:hypothetical protein
MMVIIFMIGSVLQSCVWLTTVQRFVIFKSIHKQCWYNSPSHFSGLNDTCGSRHTYGVPKSFRNGGLERELEMVQISAMRCSCIVILWVSLVGFAAITFVLLLNECLLLLLFISLWTQSGNVWIHPLYLQSTIRLHGVVLNWATDTSLWRGA